MNTEIRLFPQLKFYDMMLCWSHNADNLPPGWPVISPVVTPILTTDEYDEKDDQWYLPMTAMFTLNNSESVKVYWPMIEGHVISQERFADFCRAQATYLEAQLFKLGTPVNVFYYTISKRQKAGDGWSCTTLRYTRPASVYQQVLRGLEVGPYVIRVK